MNIKSKRAFSTQYRKSMMDINILEQQSFRQFCDNNIESSMGKYDYVLSNNNLCDLGITSIPSAILDNGANFTFVNDRKLLHRLWLCKLLTELSILLWHQVLYSDIRTSRLILFRHFLQISLALFLQAANKLLPVGWFAVAIIKLDTILIIDSKQNT